MHLEYETWKRTNPLSAYTPYTQAYYMRLAFELAEQGWFAARPNPMVGCVLVHAPSNTIVGQGYHVCYGQAHAEVNALAAWKEGEHVYLAGHEITAYVTLEPCSHTGKTPPCCEALVKAGIGCVVISDEDPNPKVAGQGIAYLKANGIPVHLLNEFQHANQALNAPFFWGCQNQRPHVTVKLAQTLDAALATRTGHSQWISGAEALAWVHTMRGGYDAILSTAETVLHDVAQLTVRSPAHSYNDFGHPPMRILLDRNFRFSSILNDDSLNAHPILQASIAPTILCVDADILAKHAEAHQMLEAMGIAFVAYNAFSPQALQALMAKLYLLGVRACWVEAGATLVAELRHQQLINELYVLLGAKLLCDPHGQRSAWLPAHSEDSITDSMNAAHSLRLAGVHALGNDALLHYTP
jgi:diaminohydroxyphosphoribosylaminopyrimidine deaminase / 5-amino-6-(5-phosphoribosylamino)uracil reductase